MEVEIDETVCGPLCQHPSCWESHKRLYKGRPRHAAKTQPPTSPDEQSKSYCYNSSELHLCIIHNCLNRITLTVHCLEHRVANFQALGSNPTHTCVCGIFP